MTEKKERKKRQWKNIIHYSFIGLMLLVVVNADVKSWLLQRLMSVGLFKAEIKTSGKAVTAVQHTAFYFTADGQTMSTADLKGKVVFINFWATWCPPCRAEMPSLDALYRKLKDDKRFVFLFISEDEDIQKAKAYLHENGFALPLAARSGNIAGELFSGTLPTTVVLNKEGEVVMKKEGLANYHTEDFLLQLKALL